MKYQIEMLSVGNADAFIIYYKDDKNSKLVLVDCGNYTDGEKVKNHLNKYYPNRHVDLAIVTHCDEDHFGGFVYLLKEQQEQQEQQDDETVYDYDFIDIRKFWINEPGDDHIDNDDVKYHPSQKTVNERANKVYDAVGFNLIELIEELEIKKQEIFSDCELDSDFKYFHILGPSLKYYNSLVTKFRHKLLLKESVQKSRGMELFALDDAYDDDSTHNASSIIFCFMPVPNHKYLFMGDANKEAWDNISINLKNNFAKKVHWLKVPHHGSEHNLTTEMIKFIHPEVAYVSIKAIGKYLSQNVVDALTDVGCSVYSTHTNDSDFLHSIPHVDRAGYSTAKPMNEEELSEE